MVKNSEEINIKRNFVQELFTPKVLMGVCAAFAWAVLFWAKSEANWEKTKDVEKAIETKVGIEDFNALKERVNRQYDANNKVTDMITVLQKQSEYQKGYQDALKEMKKEK